MRMWRLHGSFCAQLCGNFVFSEPHVVPRVCATKVFQIARQISEMHPHQDGCDFRDEYWSLPQEAQN